MGVYWRWCVQYTDDRLRSICTARYLHEDKAYNLELNEPVVYVDCDILEVGSDTHLGTHVV